MPNSVEATQTTRRPVRTVAQIDEQLASIEPLLAELLPEKHVLIDEITAKLQTAGFLIEYKGEGGHTAKLTMFDPATGVGRAAFIAPEVQRNGELKLGNYGQIKKFLNEVSGKGETERTRLLSLKDKTLEKKMQAIENNIKNALPAEHQSDTKVEARIGANGDYIAAFSSISIPYIQWRIDIPAKVIDKHGNIGGGYVHQQKADFSAAVDKAYAILELMDSMEAAGAQIKHDEAEGTLDIIDCNGKHRKVDVSFVEEMFPVMEEIALGVFDADDTERKRLTKKLKDKCDELGLEMTGDTTLLITGPMVGNEQFSHEISIRSANNATEVDELFNGGLNAAYQAFKAAHREPAAIATPPAAPVVEETIIEAPAPVIQPAVEAAAVEAFNFALRPSITGSYAGLLELNLSTDMGKIITAMHKLQKINLDAVDEEALSHITNGSADYTTVGKVLIATLKTMGMKKEDLKDYINDIGRASPLIDTAHGCSREKTLQAFHELTTEKAASHKTSGRVGFTKRREVHPKDVETLLHIIDFIAGREAEKLGIDKIVVSLDGNIKPHTVVPGAKRLGGGARGLGAEKIDGRLKKAEAVEIPAGTRPSPKPIAAPAALTPVLLTTTIQPAATEEIASPASPVTTNISDTIRMVPAPPAPPELPVQQRLPDPDHESFGRLLQDRRNEREMSEAELAREIHTQAKNSKKPLEEEVTAATVEGWEGFNALPKESTFELIKKVLIEDNQKIAASDKSNAASELEAAYQSALLAFGRMEKGKGIKGDMGLVNKFVSRMTDLRTEMGLSEEQFAEAIQKATGPSIDPQEIEMLESSKPWKLVAQFERGRKPSPNLMEMAVSALNNRKPLTPREVQDLDESYITSFAEKIKAEKHYSELELKLIATKRQLLDCFQIEGKEELCGTEICRRAFGPNMNNSYYYNQATLFFGESDIHNGMRPEMQEDKQQKLLGVIKSIGGNQEKFFDAWDDFVGALVDVQSSRPKKTRATAKS